MKKPSAQARMTASTTAITTAHPMALGFAKRRSFAFISSSTPDFMLCSLSLLRRMRFGGAGVTAPACGEAAGGRAGACVVVLAAMAERDAARAEREAAKVAAAAAEGEAKGLRLALEEARRPFWRRWLG